MMCSSTENDKSIWKTLALSLLAMQVTALAGWFMFGIDSVKHSEIDRIMATRAPYIFDKPRVDNVLSVLLQKTEDLESRVRALESSARKRE